MKPAAFALEAAVDLAEASRKLGQVADARLLAGGQSLGPMLNFRLAQLAALIPLAAIDSLRGVAEDEAAVTIGAAVTHAAIADGRAPPIGPGRHAAVLPSIAEHIAYRAVRNRGTIGGSLCHADPAADWVVTMIALGASALTYRRQGGRAIPLAQFILGPFRTALEPGEILIAVRVPRLVAEARWGYYKACRKPGEFAHAMAAVLDDPSRRARRMVIGALGTRPLLLEDGDATHDRAAAALRSPAVGLDAVAQHMQMVALARATAAAGEAGGAP
jgi:carbon-monoxide dehydrogenase medium subunit